LDTFQLKEREQRKRHYLLNPGKKVGKENNIQDLISLDIRGNISTRLRQVCVYDDDILIMARKQQALADTFIKLNEGASN
jgi:hypothetical protein